MYYCILTPPPPPPLRTQGLLNDEDEREAMLYCVREDVKAAQVERRRLDKLVAATRSPTDLQRELDRLRERGGVIDENIQRVEREEGEARTKHGLLERECVALEKVLHGAGRGSGSSGSGSSSGGSGSGGGGFGGGGGGGGGGFTRRRNSSGHNDPRNW